MGRFNAVFVFAIFITSLLLVNSIAILQDAPFPRDVDAEWQVLTELNRWRIRRGLSPLQRNTDLDLLALGQAKFVAPQVPFTGKVEFHLDEFGDGVFKRAELAGWPGYDTPDRVLVSEIAAYYPTVGGAINFWQHSPPHKKSVENSGFREAGVAVLRNKNWLISFVVLGGRPNVLPVLYDPSRSILFLTTDRSVFTDGFKPTRVQILDTQGQRLHEQEWLPWSDRLRLPDGATGTITVVVSDGIREISTEVTLDNSRIFPADPVPTPTTVPTIAPSPTPVRATSTPALPTLTPTATPPPATGRFVIQLVWNDLYFSLINRTAATVNLAPLVIVAPNIGQTRTADWLGKYSKVPLDAFPPGYCLQAWSFELTQTPPDLPDGCTVRASGRSILKPSERFWLAGRFKILYYTDLIASCETAQDECSFDLPVK